MRIGVDVAAAHPSDGHLRGIGRYVFQWLEATARRMSTDRIVCYHAADAVPSRNLLPELPNLEFRSLDSAADGWDRKLESAMRADRLDVHVQGWAFNKAYPIPHRSRSAVPLACIMFDLIPLERPAEYLGDALGERVYRAQLAVVRRYDRLLAISESAAADCIRLLKVPPRQTATIGCASTEAFHPIPDDTAPGELRALGIDSPYFLFVGLPHERRKNFAALLDAAECLPDSTRRACQIVLACPGDPDALRFHLQAAKDRKVRLTWVKRPSDDLLRTLYQHCRALVFPSVAEGFGLPILEAMQCGAPVLAAAASSLPEVAGDAALYFDPFAPLTLTARMAELLHADAALLDDLRRRGLERAKRFHWGLVADRTASALESMGAIAAGRRAG